MILVNVNEVLVETLKRDGGVYFTSPTYSIDYMGVVRQNPMPCFIPVFGILAIVNNTLMINNTNRLIGHVKPSCRDDYVSENNFIIADVVNMIGHVCVARQHFDYDDSSIINKFYSVCRALSEKGETKPTAGAGLFFHPAETYDDYDLVSYYGINEYNNIARSFQHRVTSLQALPTEYAQRIIGDSKVNNERAINSVTNPMENAYLIHHSGFMQDGFGDTRFSENVPVKQEKDPNQYYHTKPGYYDETWNWLGTDREIEAREVPEETLQEYPVQYAAVYPPVDVQQMGDTFAIPEQLTHPIKNESGEELVPGAVYKHGDGVVVEFRNSKTGDIVPVFCKEE